MRSGIGYAPGDSVLHRMNPLLKLTGLLSLTLGIMIFPNLVFSAILLLIILIFFLIARVQLKLSKGRTKFLLIFSILMFIVQILVAPNGIIFFFLVPQIGTLGPLIPVTSFGVERGFIISIRFLLIVLSSMLFVSITDPTLLAHSLSQFRIPYRYTFAIILALRFLPLFDLENQIVRMAQKSRGLSSDVGSIRKIIRTVRYTFFPLIVSALSRVDVLAMSMDGRGFGFSHQRAYVRKSEWRLTDFLVGIGIIAYLVLCILSALGIVSYFP
ncbi:MAG: energy-coupling factor transporter transmembrane component T [Candidatus Thorarchaeota archaeon]|nr:energy-coupling factor transporter transmembrane component T [Candidatus Thorarchaeota archaeon]